MKKIILFLALCACGESNTVTCGDYNVDLAIGDDSLTAVINGDTVELANVVSASGARFEGVLNDTDVIMWSKGDDWTLTLGDEPPIECK